jgi:hypothetical protein
MVLAPEQVKHLRGEFLSSGKGPKHCQVEAVSAVVFPLGRFQDHWDWAPAEVIEEAGKTANPAMTQPDVCVAVPT